MNLIFIILLPPFIGAAISWIGDKIWNGFSRLIGIITTGLSGIIATYVFILKNTGTDFDGWSSETWVPIINRTINLVINPDALSLFMALVAAFLGFLIALFSLEYMTGDEHLTRYWFYIQLFIGGMLLLVLAGDLILMYVGWETVGLCSFGLISHWYTKDGEQGEKCAKAGIKAFIYTRVGDIGFLVAIILIYQKLGSVEFSVISNSSFDNHTLSLVSFLFLMAAFGKSAQIPFIPWLSSPENVDVDAMQGPTTVSALIHAATMVKAGVYLISRIYLIIPNWTEVAIWAITIVAGLTALIAALSALVSFDLKRVLAYSTVSQLAYMFLGLSVAYIATSENEVELAKSAFISAQFHLISHAIFKSLLFLTAGYLIHKMHSRDMRDMRGQARLSNDKVAFSGFIVGGLALAGIFPFNGFWSKEAIIGVSLSGWLDTNNFMYFTAYILGAITALVTAAYVGRMFYYLFSGSSNNVTSHRQIFMPVVILLLSVLALIGGLGQLFLDTYFSKLLPKSHFHTIEGIGLIHAIILTIILILIVWIAFKSYPNKLDSIIIFKQIAIASRRGFYLEDLWNLCWDIIKSISYSLRKIHTGNLNSTMMGYASLVIIIVYIVQGGVLL